MTLSSRNRKNRNQSEIVADVLKVCCDWEAKTHIMYKAGLSYPLLRKYLSLLLDRKLILQESNHYKITPLGQAFLETYEEIGKARTMLGQREKEMKQLLTQPIGVRDTSLGTFLETKRLKQLDISSSTSTSHL